MASHPQSQRCASPRTRLLLAASALAVWSAGCAAPTLRPEPEAPPSPVYTWDAETSPQIEGDPAAALTYWRFVPLGTTAKPFATQAEFTNLVSRCRATSELGEAASSVRACLGDRGFYEAECSDGRDNDDDGLVDHTADPGCAEAHALSEAPECNDKRDNDGDGLADWDGAGFTHPDPECAEAPAGRREAKPPKRGRMNLF